jgi:hypothetical protein
MSLAGARELRGSLPAPSRCGWRDNFMQPVREIAANFAEMPLVKATPFWQPVLVVMPLAATLLGARRFGLGAHQSICEGLAPRTAGERNTDLPAAERD